MYDRETKARALEFGAVKDIRERDKALANESRSADKQLPCQFSSFRDAMSYIGEKYDTRDKLKLLSAGQCLSDSIHQKKKRLNKRIAFMRSKGDILFLTFTFRDDVLLSTSPETRRQKVRRSLSRYNALYVANIDFGSKKGREHYHAYLQMSHIDIKDLRAFYGMGAIDCEKVKSTSSNSSLSRYLCKLTNHALKDTNINYSLIYSRGFNDKKSCQGVPSANEEPLPF